MNFSDFHEQSTANFQPCSIPTVPPDFTSPSGSAYWDLACGVIRAAERPPADDRARLMIEARRALRLYDAGLEK